MTRSTCPPDDHEWPSCIRCGSNNTVVVPASGEWTCKDCGQQWHSDEVLADDSDADTIPSDIEWMLRALLEDG